MKAIITSNILFTLALQSLDLYVLLWVHENEKLKKIINWIFVWQMIAVVISYWLVQKLIQSKSLRASMQISISLCLLSIAALSFSEFWETDSTQFFVLMVAIFFYSMGNALYRPLIQNALLMLSIDPKKHMNINTFGKNIATLISKPAITFLVSLKISGICLLLSHAALFIISAIVIKLPMSTTIERNQSQISPKKLLEAARDLLPIATLMTWVLRHGLNKETTYFGFTLSSFSFGVVFGLCFNFFCFNFSSKVINFFYVLIILILVFIPQDIFNPIYTVALCGMIFSFIDLELQNRVSGLKNTLEKIQTSSGLFVAGVLLPAILIPLFQLLNNFLHEYIVDIILLSIGLIMMFVNEMLGKKLYTYEKSS